MQWREIVCEFCLEENHSANELSDQMVLDGIPEIRFSRRGKKQNRLPAVNGDLSYLPLGELTLSASGTNVDVIGMDDAFWTQASCELSLSKSVQFQISPKSTFFGSFFGKKTGGWNIQKSGVSDRLIQMLQTEISSIGQERSHFYRFRLTPIEHGDGTLHRLTVETDLLPDELAGFRVLKDFYPKDNGGAPLSDRQAAKQVLYDLAHLCRAAYETMTSVQLN